MQEELEQCRLDSLSLCDRLLVLLEEEGIFASAGSACNSGITSVSHVIKALGVPKEYAYGTIRFSMGRDTTLRDVDKTVDVLKKSVELLRAGAS